jgi:hypothetical protein
LPHLVVGDVDAGQALIPQSLRRITSLHPTFRPPIQILFETVVTALECLKGLPEAKSIAEQLGIIQKLASQAGEALETLGNAIQRVFQPRLAN